VGPHRIPINLRRNCRGENPASRPALRHDADEVVVEYADGCRIQYDGESSYDLHGNELASVIFVERGQCSKRFGQKTTSLRCGSMLLIPPEQFQADAFPVATRFLAVELVPRFLQDIRAAGVAIDDVFQLSKSHAAEFSSRLLWELCEPVDRRLPPSACRAMVRREQ
jgi:hypothetical protein